MTYEPLAKTLKDFNLNSAQISKFREMLKAEYERGAIAELELADKAWPHVPLLGYIKDRLKQLKSNKED